MSRLTESSRLDYLDATRAFALVLGVVFHASLSFMPVFMGWAVMDISTSPIVATFVMVCHAFRMETFFLLAGFFSHVSFYRQGSGEFVRARILRIAVPFVVGWFILRPLVVSGWIMGGASLRGDYEFWMGILAGFKSLEGLPAGIFTGSHLWFLYYLAVITALALGFRWLVKRVPPLARATVEWWSDCVVRWLVRSRWGLPVLALPTAAALWFMRFWGMDTPDQTLNPHVPVLLVYGGFFAVGWMLGRRRDALSDFARLSASRWALAAVGIAGTAWLAAIEQDPSHPHYVAAHVGFAASYALMMWALVFLTLGVFKKVSAQPRTWVRYLADSSYWMYLIHLPIVVWLQVAVAEVEVHWSLKLAFISGVTIALALLSFDVFVRSTWVGWLLNGRRRKRGLASLVQSAEPAVNEVRV